MTADLAALAAGLQAFVAASGADRALLLHDGGTTDPPVLIEVPADGPATVTEGEEERALDAEAVEAADAGPLPHIHPLPPPRVDPETAEVEAPAGTIAVTAAAVRELAERYPGRSVLTVTWPTSVPDLPFAIAARRGEPLVIALGQESFPLPEGWPPAG